MELMKNEDFYKRLFYKRWICSWNNSLKYSKPCWTLLWSKRVALHSFSNSHVYVQNYFWRLLKARFTSKQKEHAMFEWHKNQPKSWSLFQKVIEGEILLAFAMYFQIQWGWLSLLSSYVCNVLLQMRCNFWVKQ